MAIIGGLIVAAVVVWLGLRPDWPPPPTSSQRVSDRWLRDHVYTDGKRHS